MRLGFKIFICYTLVFSFCLYWPYDWVQGSMKTWYYEVIEDVLVDEANIMAGLVAREMATGNLDSGDLNKVFDHVLKRKLSARIYDVLKKDVDQRVYITDRHGIIIFDSHKIAKPGDDYSMWIDVKRTLKGEYGARSSESDPDRPGTSVLHIAAPIIINSKIMGVLTVAKPTTITHNFLSRAKAKIYKVMALVGIAVLLLSLLVALWLTRPVKRLTEYAHAVRKGERPDIPELDSTEIGVMGQAFEKMREALEGKKYVENYIQTFTHEIKSPLSAILGAAELLNEEMDNKTRNRFLTNISNESSRIKELVDRMLELANLENRSILLKREDIILISLVNTIIESKQPMIIKKELDIWLDIADDLIITGDPFLIHQAVANLFQNAIEFCFIKGKIVITAQIIKENLLELSVENNGMIIPEYALPKVFEKFFSLARPDTKQKSTGLGLNLVKKVAGLHGGDVSIKNTGKSGVKVVLKISLDK
jgi:two-component system, OmpR family, sensor histidine kinase CreC